MSEIENKHDEKQTAAREAIDMMFSAWVMSAFQPLFYALSHAFAHFTREGTYGHERIADELQKLAKQDFLKLSIDLDNFRSDLFDKILKKLDK